MSNYVGSAYQSRFIRQLRYAHTDGGAIIFFRDEEAEAGLIGADHGLKRKIHGGIDAVPPVGFRHQA